MNINVNVFCTECNKEVPKTENWTYVPTEDEIVAIYGQADQVFLFCYRQWTANIDRAKMLLDTAILKQEMAKEVIDKKKRLEKYRKFSK